MIRQQLQSSFGIFSLKGIDTYRADRKPDSASQRSIGSEQQWCFPSCAFRFWKRDKVYPLTSITEAARRDDLWTGPAPGVAKMVLSLHQNSPIMKNLDPIPGNGGSSFAPVAHPGLAQYC